MNLFRKQTRTLDLENKLMVTKGEAWGAGRMRSLGSTHTAIYKVYKQERPTGVAQGILLNIQ